MSEALSPCCDAPVKRKVVSQVKIGDQKIDERVVFICQKDKTEIEPHLLIYPNYPKKLADEYRETFKRTQKEK